MKFSFIIYLGELAFLVINGLPTVYDYELEFSKIFLIN